MWSSNFCVNYKRVQVLQNKAAKIIGKNIQNVKDNSVCFKSLRLLNVGQIRDYQAAIFVYNCVNNLVPQIFKEFYRFNSDFHDYDTRSCDNLVVELKNSVRSGFTLSILVLLFGIHFL